MDYKFLTERMKIVALNCGRLILSAREELMKTVTKSGKRDLVTAYDLQVQEYAVAELKKSFPEADFFCEESSGNGALGGELVFVIDPIDGTANFVHGLHHSCVSIGCLSGGRVVAAAVYNPYADELFSAYEGGGSFLNGKRIFVSEAPLEDTVAVFGSSPYNPERLEDTLDKIRLIFGKSLDIRRSGSAALDTCYVACGRYGLYFEAIVSLWDYAAAYLILREAGGAACDYEGRELSLGPEKTSIIAGSIRTVAESGLTGEIK